MSINLSINLQPINFQKWIKDNAEKFKPPVNNFLLERGSDFIVMAVTGPNQRADYHVNPTEEWFYQLQGDMLLRVICQGEFKDVSIKEGEMFLLPANVPHNPCRFAGTVGLVLERNRPAGKDDELHWYCEKCRKLVHKAVFYCVDLGTQLKPVIEEWQQNESLRVCTHCSFINPAY